MIRVETELGAWMEVGLHLPDDGPPIRMRLHGTAVPLELYEHPPSPGSVLGIAWDETTGGAPRIGRLE